MPGWWAKAPAEQPAPVVETDVEDGHKRCRFCFSGEGSVVVQGEELIKLQCACTDSDLAYAHPTCARQWFLVQRCCDVCEVCKEKALDLDPDALAQAVKNAAARREAASRHRRQQQRQVRANNGQQAHMLPISLAVLALPPGADEAVEPQPCVTWAWCPNAFLRSSWNERQAARSTILLLSVVLGLGLAVLIVNQT